MSTEEEISDSKTPTPGEDVADWNTLYAVRLHSTYFIYIRRSEIARVFGKVISEGMADVCVETFERKKVVVTRAHSDESYNKACRLLVDFATLGKTHDADGERFLFLANAGARSVVEWRAGEEEETNDA